MSWMIIETKNHRLVRMLFLLNVECGENSAVVIGRGERFIGAPERSSVSRIGIHARQPHDRASGRRVQRRLAGISIVRASRHARLRANTAPGSLETPTILRPLSLFPAHGPLQPPRFTIAPSAVGCKRVLDSRLTTRPPMSAGAAGDRQRLRTRTPPPNSLRPGRSRSSARRWHRLPTLPLPGQ